MLNAQLQAILSLLEYAKSSDDAAAAALAQRLIATTQAMFPRFDTGDWSRYELGGAYASRSYENFVTDLLRSSQPDARIRSGSTTSQTFHAYYYDPRR